VGAALSLYRTVVERPTHSCTRGWSAYQKRARLTTTKRFVLDNKIFSSIIYIWYEGVRLRPRLVKLY